MGTKMHGSMMRQVGCDIAGGAVLPEAYGAKGDGVSDDTTAVTAACQAANAAAIDLLFTRRYALAASASLNCNTAFRPGAVLQPIAGTTTTLAGAIAAAEDEQIFSGPGAVVAATAPRVSVAWWGALASVQSGGDAAPAIRAAIGSDRVMVFPATTQVKPYLITSTSPATDYPNTVPPGVLFAQLHNLTIAAHGAVFQMSNGSCPAAPLGLCNRTETFFFDRVTDLHFFGGTFLGWGYAASGPSVEVAAVALLNNIRPVFRDTNFVGYGGVGAAVAMTWNVDPIFSNIRMPQVGLCFDSAFTWHGTFDNIRAAGADARNQPTAGGAGSCFNTFYDNVLNTYNRTGVAFADTDTVSLSNSDMTNFDTAVVIQSGANVTIARNHLWGNVGSRAVPGWAVQIHSNDEIAVGGSHPHHVLIEGNTFEGNGSGGKGGAVVAAWGKAPATVGLTDILVVSNMFSNNSSAGVAVNTPNHARIKTLGNTFIAGQSQTAPVSPNLLAQYGDLVVNNAGVNPAGVPDGSPPPLPTANCPSGTMTNAVTNTNPYPVQVEMWGGSPFTLQHFVAGRGSTTIVTGSTNFATAILEPNDQLCFVGTVLPAGWAFFGL
jgi:hypothetical protein